MASFFPGPLSFLAAKGNMTRFTVLTMIAEEAGTPSCKSSTKRPIIKQNFGVLSKPGAGEAIE